MPVDGFANQFALCTQNTMTLPLPLLRLLRPFSLYTHLLTHRYMEEYICFTQWIFHVLTVEFWCRALNSPLCCHIPVNPMQMLSVCLYTYICVRLWGMTNLSWCVFPGPKMRSMETYVGFQTKTYVECTTDLCSRGSRMLPDAGRGGGYTNPKGKQPMIGSFFLKNCMRMSKVWAGIINMLLQTLEAN